MLKLSREWDCLQAVANMPALGTALPVCLYKLPQQYRPTLPIAGSWVKLRNVAAVVVDDQLLVLPLSAVYLQGPSWIVLVVTSQG